MKQIELTPNQVLYKRIDSEFADAWSTYEASWRHICHGYNTARKTALLEAESPEAAERILKTVPLFEDLPPSEGPIIKGESYLRTFFPKAEAAAESPEVQAVIQRGYRIEFSILMLGTVALIVLYNLFVNQ